MRFIFSIAFLLYTQWLLAQISSFPYSQGFETPFSEGSNMEFIRHWTANEVQSNKRIFQGTSARNGDYALHIIATSSFTAEVLVAVDMQDYEGAQLSFYAYSQRNGSASSTRPALLEISTSIDGGNTYIGTQSIGDEKTFPNNDSTSYKMYRYDLPVQTSRQSEVLLKFKVTRGAGSGSAAELIIDDVDIKETIPPLSIISLNANSPKELELVFNQTLDKSSAEQTSNYQLNYNYGLPTSAKLGSDKKRVVLTLPKALVNNRYTLTINNVKNADKIETLSETNFSFSHHIQTPKSAIVINEIFADPTGEYLPDSLALPQESSAEFIELLNTTNEHIDIGGFSLSGGMLGSHILGPKEHLILTSNQYKSTYQYFGDVLSIDDWNTLSNAGEAVVLSDQLGNLVDSLSYDLSWYKDSDKADGGWSIEQINPYRICKDQQNWVASKGQIGATPGTINSVFSDAKDLTSPEVLSFQLVNDSTLSFTFSEAMDISSLIPAHFDFTTSIPIHRIDISEPFSYEATITMQKPFEVGLFHSLTLSRIKDCEGNLIETRKFEFPIGNKASKHDLIITEIMANPSPSNGLAEVEYIELFNPSEKLISLKGVVLADKVSASQLKDSVLSPGDYLVLTSDKNVDIISGAMTLNNWPSLNNDEETLSLFNSDAEEVFSLSYDKQWYRSSIKAEGGHSLEMIDIQYPCVGEANWTSSESPNGGTPGQLNSVNGNNPDLIGPKLLTAYKINPGTIALEFSERLEPAKISLSDFSIGGVIEFIAYTLSINKKEVLLYTDSDLNSNSVYQISVDNLTDCSGNLIDPNFSDIQLIVPAEASAQDIIINEVLFYPQVGGARFVELYNQSDKFINLKDWRLAGQSNSKPLAKSDFFLAPKQFLVISNDLANIKKDYPKAVIDQSIELSSMPSMPSDKGLVILEGTEELEIDRFEYDENMHSPLLSSSRGVSLERIKYSAATQDPNNWFSASSTHNYATPGYINSQVFGEPSLAQGLTVDPPVFAPDVSGEANYTTISLSDDVAGQLVSITIYDAKGNTIKRLVENKLVGPESFFVWNGSRDDGRKARIGYYMILIELISADGQVDYKQGKVVVGGKL